MEHDARNFYIPIVDGPTIEEIEKAAQAIYRANHPMRPSCSEINAAAIARGEAPPYKDDDDIQLRNVALAQAQLRFAYRGEIIKRRYFRVYADKIVKERDHYLVSCHQVFTYRRTLVANDKSIFRLYPREHYDFVIYYNAEARGGRIKSIARSQEPTDDITPYPLDY